MDFVRDKSTFHTEQYKVNLLVNFKVQFPDQIFKERFTNFLFVDFDEVYSIHFFQALMHFLDSISEKGFRLFVNTPSPDNYFYMNFNKYPLLIFTSENNAQDYVNALAQDPGNSPADAILFNSDVIVLYSDSSDYCIYANRDFGFAIIGFKSKALALEFLDVYPAEKIWSESYTYEQLLSQLSSEENLSFFKRKFIENYIALS